MKTSPRLNLESWLEVRLDRPKKILVIETDEVIVLLLSHLLTRQSYVVHSTLEAGQADDLLRREAYDAILLDLRMPDGGVDLIRKIERRSPELLRRVIAVASPRHDLPDLSGLPLHGVIRKPVEVASLVELVRTCVRD